MSKLLVRRFVNMDIKKTNNFYRILFIFTFTEQTYERVSL